MTQQKQQQPERRMVQPQGVELTIDDAAFRIFIEMVNRRSGHTVPEHLADLSYQHAQAFLEHKAARKRTQKRTA